jgi:hypothetical protein
MTPFLILLEAGINRQRLKAVKKLNKKFYRELDNFTLSDSIASGEQTKRKRRVLAHTMHDAL